MPAAREVIENRGVFLCAVQRSSQPLVLDAQGQPMGENRLTQRGGAHNSLS